MVLLLVYLTNEWLTAHYPLQYILLILQTNISNTRTRTTTLIVNDNTLHAALTTQNRGFELKAETLRISRSKIVRPGSIRSGHKR